MKDSLPAIHIHLPKQTPMTNHQAIKVCAEACESLGSKGNMYIAIARAIEKYHGITENPSENHVVLKDGVFTKSSTLGKDLQE